MMDYYGNFPGPSRESAIQEFVEKVKEQPKWKVKLAAEMQIEEMGGPAQFGSQSGWVVFTRKIFFDGAFEKLSNYVVKRKYSIKTLVHIILTLFKLNKQSIEKVWSPGGTGYYTALQNFTNMSENIKEL